MFAHLHACNPHQEKSNNAKIIQFDIVQKNMLMCCIVPQRQEDNNKHKGEDEHPFHPSAPLIFQNKPIIDENHGNL
jgi:hypothetical protein